jgi:hypothetical protein
MLEGLDEVIVRLGAPGAEERAAESVLEELNGAQGTERPT